MNDLKPKDNFEIYTVKLIKLDPYPQSSKEPIVEKEYVATVLAERIN